MNEIKKEDIPDNVQTTEPPTIETAEKQAAELERALKESSETHLRLLAEYDNFRKRSKKELEGAFSSGFTQGIGILLPVVDNIDRAILQECTDENYKKGIELICKQIEETFSKLSIEKIGLLGEPFDPAFHNAVMHTDDADFGENSICEVFQPGYKMGERIIRIATVKVAN